MSLVLPRVANLQVAKPYIDAYNAALKTAVRVAQRRFVVQFVDMYQYFLDSKDHKEPESNYFTWSKILEANDELEWNFKLQDQIADPLGTQLN